MSTQSLTLESIQILKNHDCFSPTIYCEKKNTAKSLETAIPASSNEICTSKNDYRFGGLKLLQLLKTSVAILNA